MLFFFILNYRYIRAIWNKYEIKRYNRKQKKNSIIQFRFEYTELLFYMIINQIVYLKYVMNLGTSMKKLCRNSTFPDNFAIDVALTICAKLKNLECSMTIHRYLLSQLITDPFIHTSVNHLHSE